MSIEKVLEDMRRYAEDDNYGPDVGAWIIAIEAAMREKDAKAGINQQLTTDWQPIETAPKARVILVFRKYGTFPILAWYNLQYEWLESYPGGEHLYDLTHWMEVPKAPEAQDD